MSLSRAIVKLVVVLDGAEEIIEQADFDDYVESSFQNHDEGELELSDLKWYIVERFVQDNFRKYF